MKADKANTEDLDSPAEVELPSWVPLRESIVLHDHGENGGCVIEDQEQGKFYRLGIAEQRFVELLIETNSAETAWTNFQVEIGPDSKTSLSRAQALMLCKWLAANGLLDGMNPDAPNAAPSTSSGPALAKLYFLKIPLLNPDRILSAMEGRASWLFSWQVGVGGILVLLLGLINTSGRWSDFFANYHNLQSPWRWVWLAAIWFVLKLIHEIAHGVTCRRYGGEVREAGIAMILMMPIAYMNVTSSWRFPSRWQRLHVTLAGVNAELLIAGLALWIWSGAESPTLQQFAADTFLLASVSSLLFNLNPLLKFDGYFALADATGVDNLYSYGQSYARYWGGRYILGLRTPLPKLPHGHKGWVRGYGLAAAVYRTMTICGLVIAAAALFHGAGIIIAVAGVVSFAVRPLIELVKHLFSLYQAGDLFAGRLFARLSIIATIVAAILFVIPASPEITTPAVVQYDPPHVLRAPASGFVQKIHVKDGQTVEPGELLLTIRNDDLRLKCQKVQIQVAQVSQEVRSARWTGDSSLLQDAELRLHGLVQQQRELQQRTDELSVCAPASGRVVARELRLLFGQYVNQGDELVEIGTDERKRLKLSLHERDSRQTAEWLGKPTHITVVGLPAWTDKISHVETRATDSIPDPALASTNGGRLSVVYESEKTVLSEPRVSAFVTLSPERSRDLLCGQRAFVRLYRRQRSVGKLLWDQVIQHL